MPPRPRQALKKKTIKIYYKHNGDYREGQVSSSRRQDERQRQCAMCCRRRRHRPTDGGGPRSEGLTLAAGEETEAVVTAALAQLSRLSKRGVRAGAVLTASYRRASPPHAGPGPRWRHGRLRGRRGHDSDGGGEENGGEAALIPSLVGLWQCWTTK